MSSLFGSLFIEVDVRRSRKPEEREDALVGPRGQRIPLLRDGVPAFHDFLQRLDREQVARSSLPVNAEPFVSSRCLPL